MQVALDILGTSVGIDLTSLGVVFLSAGIVLVVLGLSKHDVIDPIHNNTSVHVDPAQDIFDNPAQISGQIPWQYLNVMTPINADSEVDLQIQIDVGTCKFRIVDYWGFPAPLGSGKWKSNIYYPATGEYVDVGPSGLKTTIKLYKRTYVSEFHVAYSDKSFEAKFTAKAKYEAPLFQNYEMILEFGRTFIAIGVSVLVTGLVILFP